ncbi:uncharacterized protein PAC_07382 [Phialocephala subalpina]|uniref:Uncharacterized protein n=1 Tax=Phialocephala subalpina TaxID=576137 RepID=A0A1L7WXJ3_9HELO|nr:uncharacterized protein PAC_07382 [Phialocephala subalpina]
MPNYPKRPPCLNTLHGKDCPGQMRDCGEQEESEQQIQDREKNLQKSVEPDSDLMRRIHETHDIFMDRNKDRVANRAERNEALGSAERSNTPAFNEQVDSIAKAFKNNSSEFRDQFIAAASACRDIKDEEVEKGQLKAFDDALKKGKHLESADEEKKRMQRLKERH